MNTKSYFITGGFGLIGSALTNSLNGKITILTRSKKNQERVSKITTKIVYKNIQDITQEDLMNIDTIYHCASTIDNYNVLTDPYIDVKTNIEGTIKLLEACKNLPKKPKIVYFSTFFVYGNEYSKTKKTLDENSKTEPLAIYPATKLASESIIKLYSKLYNIPYLICRLTNVYSENEDYNNKKKGGFNYMIMQAIKGDDLNIYKGGNFKRDYIYLDDVISAVKFLEKKNIVNDTFLIGYGKPVIFKKMVSYLRKITDNKSKIIEVEPPKFHQVVGITDFVASTAKINRLGWRAKIDYKEGIKKIVKKYEKINTIDKFF